MKNGLNVLDNIEEKVPTAGSAPNSSQVILVAEDEISNYRLMSKIISKVSSGEILWAQNGMEAVELFKQQKDITLIIMDLKMPVMDGYVASRIIKDLNPNIPIIAVTAYALADDKDKALGAGCDEYISKPFDLSEVKNAIRKYIPTDK